MAALFAAMRRMFPYKTRATRRPCLREMQACRTVLLTAVFALGLALGGGCRKEDRSGPPDVKTITTKTGVQMVLVPGGQFQMGADGDEDEKPAHAVRVGAFYIDRTEVTQKSYVSLMGANPSRFKDDPLRPVESLSWLAAVKYCNMRSLKEGLNPCYDLKTLACDFQADGYRLPTEAEWEYACRAGSGGDYSFGADPGALGGYAWFRPNGGQATHPVGLKKLNPWGLCDMYGNVAEWCNDYYSPRAYDEPISQGASQPAPAGAGGVADNPRGPASGDYRVLRGGSWRSGPERCRSAARQGEAPGLADACFGYEAYGFRCVRKAQPGS
jgi:formylglycine-generating enzyme required for sulfatase activity